uniref:Uncharacterized protein n=1 Tax=Romanomermis culicivorax TaxID=13658 RepID=A0A915JHD6_ROMCU
MINASLADLKLLLKVIPLVRPHTELVLNAVNNNILKEIPDAERVKFYDDKSDTFSQPEEAKAEEVASVFISPHCQQWLTGTVFLTRMATVPDVIVQPLTTNNIAAEFPIKTVIINFTN